MANDSTTPSPQGILTRRQRRQQQAYNANPNPNVNANADDNSDAIAHPNEIEEVFSPPARAHQRRRQTAASSAGNSPASQLESDDEESQVPNRSRQTSNKAIAKELAFLKQMIQINQNFTQINHKFNQSLIQRINKMQRELQQSPQSTTVCANPTTPLLPPPQGAPPCNHTATATATQIQQLNHINTIHINRMTKTTRVSLQGKDKKNMDRMIEKENSEKNTCTEIEFYKSFEASRFARISIFGKFPMKNKASKLIKVLQEIEKGQTRFKVGKDCIEEWDRYLIMGVKTKFVLMGNGILGGKKKKKILPYLLYEDLYDTFSKWDAECKGFQAYYKKTDMYANVSREMIRWYIEEFKNLKGGWMRNDPNTHITRTTYESRISSEFLNFLNEYTATVKLNEPNK